MSALHVSINTLLTKMDHFRNLAVKEVNAVKPNLIHAEAYTHETSDILGDLLRIVVAAERRGVVQPPDVIARLNAAHDQVIELALEISAFKTVMSQNTKLAPEAAKACTN